LKKVTFLDIAVCIFFIIITIIIIIFQFSKNNSRIVLIQTPYEKYYYSLDKNQTLNIKGTLGITTIKIENGKIQFISSPCKNKICIHIGLVGIPNYPIICLPNEVSAYILDQKNEEIIDGMAQ
jgi:hypothetical protein